MTNLGQKLLEQVAGNLYLSFIGINVRGKRKTNKQTNKPNTSNKQKKKKKHTQHSQTKYGARRTRRVGK